MKMLAAIALALAPLGAGAQSTPDNLEPSHRRIFGSATSQGGWAGSGINSGYGTGTGYGYSSASGYPWGYAGGRPGGGTAIGVPGWGYGYGYGYGGSYAGYRGSWARDWRYNRPYGTVSTAGPLAPPAVDRSPEMASAREMEEGRRRFRAGEYRAAVESFRSAVAAHPESAPAQAWFAVGLIALGEGRNADKALRSAAAGGLGSGVLSLDGLFRDDKERVRVIVALAKVAGEGGFAAAYALSLTGECARLKQLAEKDPVARQLLPKN